MKNAACSTQRIHYGLCSRREAVVVNGRRTIEQRDGITYDCLTW